MVEPLIKEQATRIREEFEHVATLGNRACIDSAMLLVQSILTEAPAQAPQAGVWKNFQDRLFQCDLADPDLREALICLATDMLTQGQQTGVLDGWTIEQWAKAAREREAMLKALESEWKRVKPLIEPVWPQT